MATIALQQQLQLQQESSCQWPHNHTNTTTHNNHNTTMVSLSPNLAININNLPTIPTTTTNRDTTIPSSSPSTYNITTNPLKRPWNENDSRDILQLMLSQFDDHQTPPSSNNIIAPHTSLTANTTLDLFGNQETITNSCADVGLVEVLPITKPPPGPPNSLLSSSWSSDCILGSSNSKSESELMTGVDPLDDAHHCVPRRTGWEKCLDLKTGEVYFVNSALRATTLNDPSESSTLEPTKDVSSQHARPMSASSAQQHGQLCLDVNPTLSLASGSTSYPYASKKNKISSSPTQEANLELNLNLSSFGPLTNVNSHLMKETFPPYNLDHVDNNQYDKDACNNSMVIVGCPCCLMYVMLLRSEPKCPKCGSHVIDTNCQGNTMHKRKSLGLEL